MKNLYDVYLDVSFEFGQVYNKNINITLIIDEEETLNNIKNKIYKHYFREVILKLMESEEDLNFIQALLNILFDNKTLENFKKYIKIKRITRIKLI